MCQIGTWRFLLCRFLWSSGRAYVHVSWFATKLNYRPIGLYRYFLYASVCDELYHRTHGALYFECVMEFGEVRHEYWPRRDLIESCAAKDFHFIQIGHKRGMSFGPGPRFVRNSVEPPPIHPLIHPPTWAPETGEGTISWHARGTVSAERPRPMEVVIGWSM